MLEVHLPTTDGRWLVRPRDTQSEREQKIILERWQLRMPEPPPPRIRAANVKARRSGCSEDLQRAFAEK